MLVLDISYPKSFGVKGSGEELTNVVKTEECAQNNSLSYHRDLISLTKADVPPNEGETYLPIIRELLHSDNRNSTSNHISKGYLRSLLTSRHWRTKNMGNVMRGYESFVDE